MLQAQQTGATLPQSTLAFYAEQLATLAQQREQAREVLARSWTMVDEEPH